MMKKDYVLIAKVLKDSKPPSDATDSGAYQRNALWQLVCLNFKNALEKENPRFDAHKFAKACGSMDPNACLKEIRELTKSLLNPHHNLNRLHVRDLLERIEALDKWLSKGGFLPDAWGGNRMPGG